MKSKTKIAFYLREKHVIEKNVLRTENTFAIMEEEGDKKLESLVNKYKNTYSVPQHPKKCPVCSSKVSVFHLNYEDAVWMCSNQECVWPLATHKPSDILGKSDVETLVEIRIEKRKRKGGKHKKKKNSWTEDFSLQKLLHSATHFSSTKETCATDLPVAGIIPTDTTNHVPSERLLEKHGIIHAGGGEKGQVNLESPGLGKTPLQDVSVEVPSVEEPSAQVPSVEVPSVQVPSVEKASAEEASAEEPSVEKPYTGEPSVEEPSAEEPSAEEPSVEDVSHQQVVECDATKSNTDEEPSGEEPSVEKPSTEEPSAEEPSVEDVSHQQVVECDATKSNTDEDFNAKEPTVGPPLIRIESDCAEGKAPLESRIDEEEPEEEDFQFQFSYFSMPVPVSPLAASPSHSSHDGDQGLESVSAKSAEESFARPTSTIRMTPLHMPSMLSPIPMTPTRELRLEEDLRMTTDESEVSDMEKTPKVKRDYYEVPSLMMTPPRVVPMREESRSSSSSSSSSSPMKMLLKRSRASDQWNVEDQLESEDVVLPDGPAVSGKQPKKLDKVVLNLKKTAGGNNWNVTSDNNTTAAAALPAPPPPHLPSPVSTEVQQIKRSRKSKTAPKKIQSLVDTVTPQQAATKPTILAPIKHAVEVKEKAVVNEEPTVAKEKAVVTEAPTVAKEKETKVTDKPDQLKVAKVVKTFSRKNKVNSRIESSLGNRLSMSVGMVGVTVDIIHSSEASQVADDSNANESSYTWREVAELAKKATASTEEEYPEMSSLMKAATGSSTRYELGFVQKVQKSLSLKGSSGKASGTVTFHVGQSKSNIDLPTEESSVDVSDANSTVKVMLSADSDGIEGEALKVKASASDFDSTTTTTIRRRGRPPKVREGGDRAISPSPTLVPQPAPIIPQNCVDTPKPFGFTAPVTTDYYYSSALGDGLSHQQQASAAAGFDEFLSNPIAVQKFKYHLNVMMQGYELPPEWASHNIDPCVAMMVTRSQDPAYASINFDAMLQLYAKLVNYELMLQSHYQQQETQCVPEKPDRTYTELQTVRSNSGQVTDATQVLRQHQASEKQNSLSDKQRVVGPGAAETVTPVNNKRMVIKEEAMTPMDNSSSSSNGPSSVDMLSVRPGPQSVSVIPSHLAKQMMGSKGKIGEGTRPVSFAYNNCYFGPIFVKTDEEVRALVALTKEKIAEREFRDSNGGRGRVQGISTAAAGARSLLAPDVIAYLDRAFTKRGLKGDVVGRKQRNYPKGSAIIKKDPVTGELIYPPGHQLHKSVQRIVIKQEVLQDASRPAHSALERAVFGSTGGLQQVQQHAGNQTPRSKEDMYQPPTPVFHASIDQIISNTQQPVVVQEKETTIKVKIVPKRNKTAKSNTSTTSAAQAVKVTTTRHMTRSRTQGGQNLSMPPSVVTRKRKQANKNETVGNVDNADKMKKEHKEKAVKVTDAKKKAKQDNVKVTDLILPTFEPDKVPEQHNKTEEKEENKAAAAAPAEVDDDDDDEEIRKVSSRKKILDATLNILTASMIKLPEEELPKEQKKTVVKVQKDKPVSVPTHSISTRRSSLIRGKQSHNNTESSCDASRSIFQPCSSSSTTVSLLGPDQSQLYIRQDKEKKVQLLLERKKKKDARMEKRKLKRIKKTGVYQGMGLGSTNSEPSSSLFAGKFTTAQTIGGKKMVLKQSGELIHLPVSKKTAPAKEATTTPEASAVRKPAKLAPITQKERDIIDELLRIGEEAQGLYSDPIEQQQQQSSFIGGANCEQQMMDFEMANTAMDHHGAFGSDDVPSLEDIL